LALSRRRGPEVVSGTISARSADGTGKYNLEESSAAREGKIVEVRTCTGSGFFEPWLNSKLG
jgi:hypothetical protein